MTADTTRRKLLFHIGHHKTGSTSIQHAFATGRVQLEGGRILYPGQLTHNYLRRHIDTYLRQGRLLPGSAVFPGLAALSALFKRGDFDVAVISGETFENATPTDLRKVLQDFLLPHVTDHAIICYIRPHAGRLLSGFAEALKIGQFSGPLDRFAAAMIKGGRLHYTRHLGLWTDTFGADLHLRPMIRSELAKGSVLHDFLQTGFGADAPVKVTSETRVNESLCLEDLVLVRLVQDQLKSRNRNLRLALGWELATNFGASLRRTPGTRLTLHRALAEKIRTTYREDAKALDARYFGSRALFQTDLDRSVDEALPQPQSLAPQAHYSAEALRAVSVLGAQINVLIDHQNGAWSDFLRKRRIAALHDASE